MNVFKEKKKKGPGKEVEGSWRKKERKDYKDHEREKKGQWEL